MVSKCVKSVTVTFPFILVLLSIPVAFNVLPSIIFCDSGSMATCSLLAAQNLFTLEDMTGSIQKGINAETPGSHSSGSSHARPTKIKVNTTVERTLFPKEFVWGTATAAYQVEGAYNEGGRGLSIWDTFSRIPGKTANGDTGDVACDQYHRYEEDIQLMVDAGFDAYRFSISWSRILPDGDGEVNPEGVAYYNRLIDALLAKGIQPYVTLFHWDSPQALEDKYGGWLDEQIIAAFARYASLCFLHFGDRVRHWITFNEPLTFSTVGYGWGAHAPGRCSRRDNCHAGDSAREPYAVVHNILRAHAHAVHHYRTKFQASQKGIIGITVDSDWSEPATNASADVAAAQRRMEFQLGWMLDPVFKGDYPPVMRRHVGGRLPAFTTDDAHLLSSSLDFVGINHYTSRWVKDGSPPANENASSPFADQWLHCEVTKGNELIGSKAASDWLYIVPWGLEKLLVWVQDRYNPPAIFITENGMDEEDDPSLPLEEALQDPVRVQFYNDYLTSVSQAIKKGVKVKGYFAWSFMDNFEWAMGYTRRFGMHYVDYANDLKRYPKLSALWWKKFLQ